MGEKLSWIIDKIKNTCGDETEYKENRDFVHTLGLKCDRVGWCDYDLEADHTDEILDKMEKYIKETHCHLRGRYERTNSAEDSEWYKLKLKYVSAEYKENEKEIRAYKIPKRSNCIYDNGKNSMALVSEDFRKVCIEEQFSGVKFRWMKDIGKYKSQQYFSVYLSSKVPTFYSCNNLSVADSVNRMKLGKLGGKLPKLLTLFYDLSIDIPICIQKNDLPETAFAFYKYDTYSYVETGVLIRKKEADILLQRRLIAKSDLEQISIVEEIPLQYEKYKSEELEPPSIEEMQNSFKAYEEFLKTPRQERSVNEEMALQIFRKQKKVEKEYFNKGLPKTSCEALAGTIYEIMIPYYHISDGAVLSDEYTLLSHKDSVFETKEFVEDMKLEEWLVPLDGVVIAKGADGDAIVLTGEKKVERISHEDYEAIEQWENVQTFMFDSI